MANKMLGDIQRPRIIRDAVNQLYALTWNILINPGYPAYKKKSRVKSICSETGNKSNEMQRKSGA